MGELRWAVPADRLVMRRLWNQIAVERGLCRQCCKPIGEDPRTLSKRVGPPKMCRGCLDKALDWNRSRRAKRKAAGLCVRCGHSREGVDQATTGTGTMCRPCSDEINSRSMYGDRARYRRRRDAGLCTSCPNPRGKYGTAKQCRPCADKSNTRKRVNRAKKRGRMPLAG